MRWMSALLASSLMYSITRFGGTAMAMMAGRLGGTAHAEGARAGRTYSDTVEGQQALMRQQQAGWNTVEKAGYVDAMYEAGRRLNYSVGTFLAARGTGEAMRSIEGASSVRAQIEGAGGIGNALPLSAMAGATKGYMEYGGKRALANTSKKDAMRTGMLEKGMPVEKARMIAGAARALGLNPDDERTMSRLAMGQKTNLANVYEGFNEQKKAFASKFGFSVSDIDSLRASFKPDGSGDVSGPLPVSALEHKASQSYNEGMDALKKGDYWRALNKLHDAYQLRSMAQHARNMGLDSVMYKADFDVHGRPIKEELTVGSEKNVFMLERTKMGTNEDMDISKDMALAMNEQLYKSGQISKEQYEDAKKSLNKSPAKAFTLHASYGQDGKMSRYDWAATSGVKGNYSAVFIIYYHADFIELILKNEKFEYLILKF